MFFSTLTYFSLLNFRLKHGFAEALVIGFSNFSCAIILRAFPNICKTMS